MFSGSYHGRKHHRNDILDVLKKASRHHVVDILLTGSSLDESKRTIEIINSLRQQVTKDDTLKLPELYSTVGVHPCTVLEFESAESVEQHLKELENLISEGIKSDVVRAFGEIGLDYDRLHYTPMEKQLVYFEKQLQLAAKFDLPLFLHMRSACEDFINTLKPFLDNNLLKNKNLLVHSFTGDKTQLEQLFQLEKSNPHGYKIYISINGAGLRDTSTLEILPLIPLDRLMLETDSPWCEIKRTHPSWKYLSRSPNAFYPCDYENYELVEQRSGVRELKENSVKNKKNSNNTNLTLFDFLPIPTVKSDKFDKFQHAHIFEDSPLIKSRNEPCLIGLVAQVISEVRKEDPQKIIDSAYQNSKQVFG
ncbi:hypothetical protein PMKS-000606 [Pichia membranifaciens]|uniref:Uncharacterized protein n=1 Tax=Pichia membranifaciens TaxID=4926 RepID=A0A1Q2YC91_9ASCO|nr:hypothetical protein PMKS-000606 [Pichia membranifaciens]